MTDQLTVLQAEMTLLTSQLASVTAQRDRQLANIEAARVRQLADMNAERDAQATATEEQAAVLLSKIQYAIGLKQAEMDALSSIS